jgi:general secretion pathway protein J
MMQKSRRSGFTLIELLVAIVIFAIISIISYRTLSSLLTTKETVSKVEEKWSGITNGINLMSTAWHKAIPLVVRAEGGEIIPALWGKTSLNSLSDSQLEFTTAGFIGDPIYGSNPPKRLGFRFQNNKLYLVTWPVLNRVETTKPQLNILIENVELMTVNFLYPDRQWREIWPQPGMNLDQMPLAIKIYIKMRSGEEFIRQWAYLS